ncbi:putative Ni/Fe-hydrogenase B-type cytochrome subunit [Tepidimonas alkaliphilus]|uniref:Putative Ni/Fe-hydrogenase B-type cytochrome subunit n=1 Tax=Tepidimonas alkaliphilus TaxID=2588942 RepID=A0A554WBL4_9BURK|nr:cytochrome b/b6 domain-containing protein [Tepidimonas alkaliphilus]TSE20961.1 putative Ni/Fe-hydrogenase B-type cytochrome subunit [Tepidimonas alkaliphilus]
MQRPAAVYVWDPFVRVFHWSLVTCVVLNLWVLEEGETAHRWVGYAAAAWVGLRLLWGLVGSRHARFADWWPTPARLRAHARAVLAGEPDANPGHNPFGALMMLALMALVLALGLTGWLMQTDALFGEEWLEDLHEALANALLVAAAVHAAAALVMGRLQRVSLVRAMFTGVKRFE